MTEISVEAGPDLEPEAPKVEIEFGEIADEDPTPPPPVLWSASAGRRSPLLSEGEVAVFSGPGGMGKSTISLTIASESASALNAGRRDAEACGIGVRAGRTVCVSYEDSPARLAARLKWHGSPKGVLHWKNREPLFRYGFDEATGERRAVEGDAFEPFWSKVRDAEASLVIIDPVAIAFSGVSLSDPGAVRDFIDALTKEATRSRCGVLLVAHDTKTARNEARAGANPGAGAIAGSAGWHDGARSALYLFRGAGGEAVILECVKSNYGPTGWGARLLPRRSEEGDWRGYVIERGLTEDDIAEERADIGAEVAERRRRAKDRAGANNEPALPRRIRRRRRNPDTGERY